MLLLVFVFLSACFYFFWRNKRSSAIQAPSIPNPIGLLWKLSTSNLRDIFKEIIKIGEYTADHGGVTKINAGIVSIYFITSPADASAVLYQCAEKSFVYDLIKPYVGSQLVAASVPVFKKNKRITDLVMKSEILDQYLVIFNKYSARLVDIMAQKLNMDYDFREIITRSILEIVSQTTMGMSIDGEDLITDRYANAVANELDVLMGRARYPWLFFDVFFNLSSLKKKQDDALEIIWGLSDQIVKTRKEEHLRRLRNENVKAGDFESFLEIVIKNTVSEDSEVYTDEELRNLVDNMMLAGFDTTAAAMVYVLICLGSHPQVQEKLFEELNRVVGRKGKPITREDLFQLTYLDAVVKETLRLYPIGPVIARRSNKDIKLEKCVLPTNSQVVVHVWSMNRNKLHWGPDAEEFKPERWLDPSTLPSHPVAFSTFAPGRRYCIGKTYAMNLIKIVTAHIIHKYQVTADVSKLELEMVVLLKAVGGHIMRLDERN